jgi:hypothetical protein
MWFKCIPELNWPSSYKWRRNRCPKYRNETNFVIKWKNKFYNSCWYHSIRFPTREKSGYEHSNCPLRIMDVLLISAKNMNPKCWDKYGGLTKHWAVSGVAWPVERPRCRLDDPSSNGHEMFLFEVCRPAVPHNQPAVERPLGFFPRGKSAVA